MSQHPLPDLDAWATVSDPEQRLRIALTEIYTYYAETEPMLTNLLRDLDVVEAVQQQFTQFLTYLEDARQTLMIGRRERGRAAQRARAAVGHGLSFTTWRSLVREQGCEAHDAVDMMCRSLLALPRDTARDRGESPAGACAGLNCQRCQPGFRRAGGEELPRREEQDRQPSLTGGRCLPEARRSLAVLIPHSAYQGRGDREISTGARRDRLARRALLVRPTTAPAGETQWRPQGS